MAAAAQEMEDKVRGLEDIPSPPLVPVLKHLPLILNKKNAYDMTTFAAGLREKFGDIVRLQIPGMGNGNMIMLFKAKAGLNNLHKNEMIIFTQDIKTMYSSDGRIPMLPGFDNFEYARAVTLKHRFPTCGLISNKVREMQPAPLTLSRASLR